MEVQIVYAYTKKRGEFGRQCNFTDRAAELHVDIAPNPALLADYVEMDPVDKSTQLAPEMAEHEVNTEIHEYITRGINHTEGGWPSEIDPSDLERVARYRWRAEKEPSYLSAITRLADSMEHKVKQNNAMNIYEEYFEDEVCYEPDEPASGKTVNVFRDPNQVKRIAHTISWCHDDPRKFAVAYCNLEFQGSTDNMSFESYVWDIENPTRPEFRLKPNNQLVCLEYSVKDPYIIVGGQYNGQISFWDVRKSPQPIDTSLTEFSHHDPVYKTVWIQSKTGSELFSASTDGQILWWDIRRLGEPYESLILDPTRKENIKKAHGGMSLEYEPTLPTRFMVGTEQGTIVSCNRKAKTPPEKIMCVYHGHHGPVSALQRNPLNQKIFLSVGDWTARIWAEDVRESSIIWTKYHMVYLTDGCWSPIRPGVFLTTKMDGTLDAWDLMLKHTDPVLSVRVCDEALFSLRVQEHGRLVACGSEKGSVSLVDLSENLYMVQTNEKQIIAAMFERETRREKLLEARHREAKLKRFAQATEEAAEEVVGAPKPKQEEDPLVKAEKDFFFAIEQERKKREQFFSKQRLMSIRMDPRQSQTLEESDEEQSETSEPNK